jgi:hypothetical protein
MAADPLELAVRAVLRAFAVTRPGDPVIPLGNCGGFSGARLWRVETVAGPLCLRAWPPHDPTPERLAWIHTLLRLARDAGLTFVPAALPARGGRSARAAAR